MPHLLIDDGLGAEVDLLRTLLARAGWQVATAPAADAMLVEAARRRPDWILLLDRSPGTIRVVEDALVDPGLSSSRLVVVDTGGLLQADREAATAAGVRLLPCCLDARGAVAERVAVLLEVPTRACQRTQVAIEVQGRAIDGIFYGHAVDLSTGGLRLETSQRFRVGDDLFCFFSLCQPTPVIFARARVVRARDLAEDLHEYGLSFLDMKLDDRRRIAETLLPRDDRYLLAV